MHPRDLAIADFTYDLPAERIAQFPLQDRDAGRLLVYRSGAIADHRFQELPAALPAGALLVMNDTRVVHARLAFRRATGALIECMVLTPADGRPIEQALLDRGTTTWWCMVGNAKRWKGEELMAEHGGAKVRMRSVGTQHGEHRVAFTWDEERPFLEVLATHGDLPLPPYMKRAAVAEDETRYNTVFAERAGSVAAPTASLHFSSAVLEALQRREVSTAKVTLHVGAGTFLPVKSTTMEGHAMHSEQVRIPLGTVRQLRRQLDREPIIPVGTTALRTIESLYWYGADLLQHGEAVADQLAVDQWRPYAPGEAPTPEQALNAVVDRMERRGADALTGHTSLLIAPGYRFRLAQGLVTNFHQPNSTLLLLVAALVGLDWRRIYAHALANDYRFLSYGDASLLLPEGWSDNRPR